jgi:hypothetical protein
LLKRRRTAISGGGIQDEKIKLIYYILLNFSDNALTVLKRRVQQLSIMIVNYTEVLELSVFGEVT